LDGRLQKANRSLTPAAEVRPTAEILLAMAESAGVKLNSDWSEELEQRVALTEIVK